MAKDEKQASAAELTDVRTSGEGAAGANAPVRTTGKVQKGNAESATSDQPRGDALEGAEDKQKVIVNPALRSDAGVPYIDEDGNAQLETFAAGKVHYVDAQTAELKFGGVELFKAAPEDSE